MSATRAGPPTGERELKLRPATIEDAQIFFEWVNSPDSLAHKLETNKAIDWSTHIQWFETRLQSRDGLLAVIELDSLPAGQVRLEKKADGYHVDLFIVSEVRRTGIAARVLRRVLEVMKSRPIVATVLRKNEASHRLFRSIGFTETFSNSEVTIYKKFS